jgi:hypothetical protein
MNVRSQFALKGLLFSAVCAMALPLAQGADPPKTAESEKTAESGKTTLVNGGLRLTVPESWKNHKTNSNVHLMQFTIPNVEGEKGNAAVSVWYFGLNGYTTIDSTLQSWMDEFYLQDRKVKVVKGKTKDGEYVLLDVTGKWNRPVETPQGGLKVVVSPDSREIAVALIIPHQGSYYLRLMGPEKTVAANVDAFRASFGADEKSEKDYKALEPKTNASAATTEKTTAQKPVGPKPEEGKNRPKK